MRSKLLSKLLIGTTLIFGLTQCSFKNDTSSEFISEVNIEKETNLNSSQGLRTYNYTKLNPFIIGYPIGYQLEEDISEQIEVAFTHPMKDIHINVVTTSYKGDKELFIHQSFNDIQAFFTQARIITHDKITVNKQDVYQLVLKVYLEEQSKRIYQYSIFRDKETLYILTFITPDEDSHEVELMIEKVLQSFRY